MHILIGLSPNNGNAFWGIVSVAINAASVWIFTRWDYPKFAAVVAFFRLTHYIFDFSDIYFCERGHYLLDAIWLQVDGLLCYGGYLFRTYYVGYLSGRVGKA